MQIDVALAHRMVRDSAELGLELFHIDAGWFRGVGDWYPSPSKFPHGFAPIVADAHQRGLKFGLWVDWAQAGVDSSPGALNVNDPKVKDWLVADVPEGWRPAEFVGRTIDLGYPPARDYSQREVDRIITDYHLDMLEHDGYVVAKNCARTDHPHAGASPPQMSTVTGNGIHMPNASNSSDVSYHAVRAYYDIYTHMRQQHPGLLFEICNDGGRMVDFGSASHGDYFSITDAYDPLSNRRAFYDTSHVLPAAMLEDYVEKWPTPTIENFRYMLRSGMMGMLTVMQDTNAWTLQEHAAAKAEFALYKEKLRPLIRDADLYHVSPRPDGLHWDGIEYFNANRRSGVVYAFRGSTATEGQHTFQLQGVRPGSSYRLHFVDQSAPDQSISGRKLLDSGLTVVLSLPQSSELIFLEETR
jgi:alpha-galactosidase